MLQKEKIRELIQSKQTSLPLQALFLEIDISEKETSPQKNISISHGTSDYSIYTFYKVISIYVNLSKYE